MLKQLVTALTAFMTLFWSMACTEAAKPDKWLIYWYVCGTDIETTRIAFSPGTDLMSGKIFLAEPDREPGDATRCINEVEKANLSPNVKIFMQAGGTYIWGHPKFRDLNAKIQTLNNIYTKNEEGKFISIELQKSLENKVRVGKWSLTGGGGKTVATPVSNGQLGRYVYDKAHRNWHAREQLPITGKPGDPKTLNNETDMGSQAGFVSFLRAGQKLEQELYPEGNVRRVLIIKDHGAGIGGVCIDEYTKNILSLEEIKNAFNEVKSGWTNAEKKPFEVVAFDACEMSVLETTLAVKDAANYMVASQEVTDGKIAFNYTELLNALSKNPTMSGKKLGRVICDTRWEDSENVDKEFGRQATAVFTESVIDLSEEKMDALQTAYTNFKEETDRLTEKNSPDIIYNFTKLKNAENVSERFPLLGGGTPTMIDLKNFATNVKAAFPELEEVSSEVVKAVDNSVVYNKRGSTYKRGGGLSIHHHLPKNLTGISLNFDKLKDKSIDVDEENKTASITLKEDDIKYVESVRYQLFYFIPRNDDTEKFDVALLGGDSEVAENRQEGTFTISFKNKKWVTLDDNPLYFQVLGDSTRKNKNGKKISGNDICMSPILLNGEPYKLYFSRTYPSEKVTLIGVLENKDGTVNLPNDALKSLKKGDVVIPLYIYANADRIENSKPVNVESMTPEQQRAYIESFTIAGKSITIGDKPKMEMVTLYNGILGYVFEFVNPVGKNVITSNGVACKIKNGKVVAVKDFDDVDNISDLED